VLSKFVTCMCFWLGPNIILLCWAKRDFCMLAAHTIFFIIFKISPTYASWRVTLLLVLFCHVQNSVSCSLHCCNYIFALVMCTYRNISGWSDINTKIYEQCGMAITEWLWIGIGMCWCSRASTRGGKTTCTWLSTYNQQVETGHAGIRCRSQKNETRHWGNHEGIGDFADWNLCYLNPANPIFWRDYSSNGVKLMRVHDVWAVFAQCM